MMNRWLNQDDFLNSDRVWRWLLVSLFVVTVLSRFLIHQSMSDHPVGRLDEVPQTIPSLYRGMAVEAVLQENWALKGANFLITNEMRRLAPAPEWYAWSGQRLPRGAPGVYLAAASYSLTQTMAIYTIVTLLLGGVLTVISAASAARFFHNRRAGVLVGVYTMAHGTIALGTVVLGPWLWEVLALALVVYTVLRVRDDRSNAAEWVLLGLAVGFAIIVRSLFLWSFLLVPLALWRWKVRPSIPQIIAVLLPAAIFLGGLVIRNERLANSTVPLIGQPAWELYLANHPNATQRTILPGDLGVYEAANGSLPRTVRLLVADPTFQRNATTIISRKIRESLGSRDIMGTINIDYLRRRTEPLRLFTLGADVMMAMAWASFFFLLYRRNLRTGPLVLLCVLILHLLLFQTEGMERSLMHWVLGWMVAAALIEAFANIKRLPSLPFVLLLLYGASMWLLAVDDQGRGSRYRIREFAYASRYYLLHEQNFEMSEAERLDYYEIQRHEILTTGFWNVSQ